ncbi:MAG: single-stranded DNA-binding protein [Desulfobacterales bacterium]
MNLKTITQKLLQMLQPLHFGPPITHVYNPLEYAGTSYNIYLERYAVPEKEILLVGMNPGPWGMIQTGVPFGDVNMVKNWMGIETAVGQPENPHLKRPVLGFSCPKSEVSGRRLWNWAAETYESAESFFERFLVINYCPMAFFGKDGRNFTPNLLRAADRKPLLSVCDSALAYTIEYLKPHYVLGVGKFAAQRIEQLPIDRSIVIGSITHPSPANPKANRGWSTIITRELQELNIAL